MFNKILIANRGEIACRVIQTARRMGIATVAVYSDADAGARHVRMADEAVRIGPAPARESTSSARRFSRRRAPTARRPSTPLRLPSENEAFAESCAAAGVVFIGPPPRRPGQGSKSAAKALWRRRRAAPAGYTRHQTRRCCSARRRGSATRC